MTPIDIAARLEALALGYYRDARLYSGRRRAVRAARGDYLMARAWTLIGLDPEKQNGECTTARRS